MGQGVRPTAVSLAARRGPAARLPRRVRRANPPRLSAPVRWARLASLSTTVHHGDAVSAARQELFRGRRRGMSKTYVVPELLLLTRTLVAIGPVSPMSSL